MIEEFKYLKYGILGRLCVNLSHPNSSGKIYKNIILAGQNGTGKTQILETLFNFLEGSKNGKYLGTREPFEYIVYKSAGKTYKIFPDSNNLTVIPDRNGRLIWDNDNLYSQDASTLFNEIEKGKEYLYSVRAVYSPAFLIPKTKPIINVSSETIDEDRILRNEANYSVVKELLIKLYLQDDHQFKTLYESGIDFNINIPIQDFLNSNNSSLISRFTKAFHNFFNGKLRLEFLKIEDRRIDLTFNRNGKSVPLDDLSSGEKQIIFRGASLLNSLGNMEEGYVFIDEPETSMHPTWQQKILNYYLDLFNNTSNIQTFVATHSEEVIKSTLSLDDTVVIVLKEKDGVIQNTNITNETFVLRPICASEVDYVAFGVPTPELVLMLYERVRNENPVGTTQKETDRYIRKSPFFKPHHRRTYKYKKNNFKTLPTYVRNAIAHPNENYFQLRGNDLEIAVELLIKVYRELEKENDNSKRPISLSFNSIFSQPLLSFNPLIHKELNSHVLYA